MFRVTRNIPCCFLFSEVTEKPLSYSKDTLLISGEINNPSRNGLRKQLLLRLSKHRFPMPKLSKRRIGTEGQYPFGDVGGIYMHVSTNGRTQAYANKKLQVIRMDIEYKECVKTVMF